MAGSKEERIYSLICYGLMGIVFLVVGVYWLNSVPEGGCPCDSVHCCSLDEACPYHAPCLCVRASNHSAHGTCAPKTSSNTKTYYAWAMITIGVLSSHQLALLLLMLALFVVFGILVKVAMAIRSVLRALWNMVKKIGSVPMRLYLKVSLPWKGKKDKTHEE